MIKRLLACLLMIAFAQAAAANVRLKDLVEFDGVRGNDLIGYGLVVGLNGTGDGIRNSPFTEDISNRGKTPGISARVVRLMVSPC